MIHDVHLFLGLISMICLRHFYYSKLRIRFILVVLSQNPDSIDDTGEFLYKNYILLFENNLNRTCT